MGGKSESSTGSAKASSESLEMEKLEAAKAPTVPSPIDFAKFLTSVPYGKPHRIDQVAFEEIRQYSRAWETFTPVIKLHCDSIDCGDTRIFYCSENKIYPTDLNEDVDGFLIYTCRNCRNTKKKYALSIKRTSKYGAGIATKYGEIPSLNIVITPKMKKLVGGNWELFRKGLQAETHGQGIGAFSYYRRVVESQKNKLFDQLIKACEKLPNTDEIIPDLKAAKDERQFMKAVDSIKHALPDGLLVDGHNPLKLLHDILSEGMHELDDDECLDLARAVRVILSDLSERMDSALKEHKEVSDAIGKILKKKSKENQPSAAAGSEE